MPTLTVSPDFRSLAERAYLQLRDQLVMLEIRPGAPINDDQLAASLGMGRTPVREALKRLEAERLVVAHPRRGTFATDVNITDLRHIFEVRQQLEPFAAATAAHRATAADRRELTEPAADVAQAAPPDQATTSCAPTSASTARSTPPPTIPYLEDTLVRYDNLATRIWCLFTDQLQRSRRARRRACAAAAGHHRRRRRPRGNSRGRARRALRARDQGCYLTD